MFNKMYPGWLNLGTCWGTLGRVSQYAPGATISPFIKGVTRASALASPQSDHLHSVDLMHAKTFPPKQIMMSLEHCVVTSRWCKAAQRARLTSSRVLQYIPTLGYPGISTLKSNHVFSSLFYHGHVPLGNQASIFINLHCLIGCQINVPSYKDWTTQQQGVPPFLVLTEACRNGSGSTQSALCLWHIHVYACIYVCIYIGRHAWAYICVCRYINKHIKDIDIRKYIFRYVYRQI